MLRFGQQNVTIARRRPSLPFNLSVICHQNTTLILWINITGLMFCSHISKFKLLLSLRRCVHMCAPLYLCMSCFLTVIKPPELKSHISLTVSARRACWPGEAKESQQAHTQPADTVGLLLILHTWSWIFTQFLMKDWMLNYMGFSFFCVWYWNWYQES